MTFDELEMTLRARHDVIIGTGCKEEVAADAERALGVCFPRELRKYLVQFGHLELGPSEMFGLGEELPEHLNIVTMTMLERGDSGSPVRHDLVPLLNDGAGNLYCVGTSGAETGCVLYWDHELGPNQQPKNHATSLAEWIIELLLELDGQNPLASGKMS
ncbi:MAG: SMI1/KNR4 family protein [Myxococcales bacterium]|nr:SMI1/KNR4 family protein [Myxococcales bacterium]